MFAERQRVNIATATDGTFTGYTEPVTGRVLGIHYIADGTTPLTASTASLAVTSERYGTSILARTATGSFDNFPRLGTHSATGGAQTATGTTNNLDALVVVQDRIKVTVASGGASKLGALDVVIG